MTKRAIHIFSCCLAVFPFSVLGARGLRGDASSLDRVLVRREKGVDEWTYVYDPSLLPLPPGAKVEHAHGIAIQRNGNIVVTYKDQVDETRCLLRWNASAYQQVPEFLGPGESLCRGVPHGLQLAFDKNDDRERPVLYHANNEQSLHKTKINGDIIWSNHLRPEGNDTATSYRPTWFASQPGSPFVYLADGYGSSKIYVYNKTSGDYTGQSFAGQGVQHGKFSTCHAIQWDWRRQQMVVSDRENHRLEYFRVNPNDETVFEYRHTVSFYPGLKRPCNIRIREEDGMAIVPFLEGYVGILDYHNKLVSVVNISETLGHEGFLHPHDAHFLPGTDDFVVVTWNPGRIGVWRRRTFPEPTTELNAQDT